mmetsp:Transcript_6379/g.13303  ORF Transcript_6379/g.13303 Transcript_6379/m.13303 type:complete len:205 (-) Transcript_6379:718-1332(-)
MPMATDTLLCDLFKRSLDAISQVGSSISAIYVINSNVDVFKHHFGQTQNIKIIWTFTKWVIHLYRYHLQTNETKSDEENQNDEGGKLHNIVHHGAGQCEDPNKEKGSCHLDKGEGEGGCHQFHEAMISRHKFRNKGKQPQFLVDVHRFLEVFHVASDGGPHEHGQHDGGSLVRFPHTQQKRLLLILSQLRYLPRMLSLCLVLKH